MPPVQGLPRYRVALSKILSSLLLLFVGRRHLYSTESRYDMCIPSMAGVYVVMDPGAFAVLWLCTVGFCQLIEAETPIRQTGMPIPVLPAS